ncbi:Uma2 family endonuclease [Limnoglobus roseus]|uniref:Uma2 family endonuclease n=1 Tax=Limnoglobus roseus TaxID=2598579 RepID=A0A5C1ALB4_9BACT|nr:Uma2 family endonuclease [Limnoglobus roseus]QEL20021.1 Uma2 family endonuclease [Limnoglobus roseus]
MTVAEALEIYEVEDVADINPVPRGYELIDGELVEIPSMGVESSLVLGRIFYLLHGWCEQTQLGIAIAGEAGYRCFPWKPKQVRKPDVAVILCDPKTFIAPKGDAGIVPDLVVEVVSPNDTVVDLDTRVREFLRAGTKLVWVVNPDTREVLARRADGTIQSFTEPADLTGENLLPGLRVSLAAFLPPLRTAPTV